MSNVDTEMETALGGSVLGSYRADFSGRREVVDHSSPAVEAVMNEGESLRRQVEHLQAKIRLSEEAGLPVERIRQMERKLDEVVEAWVEFATEDNTPTPGADLEGYVSLGDLLQKDLDTRADLDREAMDLRLSTLRDLNRFVFQDGGTANLWLAWKNWLAVVRRASPELLDRISKADLAELLGETRAATCDREIRVVERVLRQGGAKGFQLLGGNKSLETRARCAESAKGNTSRRKGSQKRAPGESAEGGQTRPKRAGRLRL